MEFAWFVLLFILQSPNCIASQLGCGGHCVNRSTDCLDELDCRNNTCTDDLSLGTGAAICYASNGGRNYEGCGATCYQDVDCIGKLMCLDRICDDDPSMGTNICTLLNLSPASSPIPGSDTNPGCGANCSGVYGFCISNLECINGTCTDKKGGGTDICSPKKSKVGVIIGSVFGSVLGLGLFLWIGFWLLRWRRYGPHHLHLIYGPHHGYGGREMRVRRYTVGEIRHMTGDFSAQNLIGEGGFGIVYVGYPRTGSPLAVKRERTDIRVSSKVFLEEVQILERIHHRHVVDFRGFCEEKEEHMLLFEFMPKGNLRQVLHNPTGPVLPWDLRVRIAYHVACGLDYLHHGADPSILHLDVKPENVLLDAEYTAKVADFGISKTGNPGDTIFRTTTVSSLGGSRGYIDPALSVDFTLSTKCDVYSFGVLVLEIISGQKAMRVRSAGNTASDNGYDDDDHDEEEILLVGWVRRKFVKQEQNLSLLRDPALKGCYDHDEFVALFQIALACVDMSRESRPTMAFVKKTMEDKLCRSLMKESSQII